MVGCFGIPQAKSVVVLHHSNTTFHSGRLGCSKPLDLKYGFYISPWDRNSAHYGTDTYVKDVFLRQCAELAKYGTDQFEMWFDGANGGDGYYGGKGGIRNIDRETYYDVPNLRDTVHKVCPDCVLWGVGGEARWIGNEEGYSGETIWSPENRGFAPESNGTRGTIDGWFWLPGESDAKITNRGWFWHEGESVLSCERLFQMYLETIYHIACFEIAFFTGLTHFACGNFGFGCKVIAQTRTQHGAQFVQTLNCGFGQ